MADALQAVVGSAISLMIILVIFYLGPGLGESISDAMPICSTGDFADATTGAEVWGSGAAIMSVVVIIAFIAIAIKELYNLQKK